MMTVTGLVKWQSSQLRIKDALVAPFPLAEQPVVNPVKTDKDGNFSIDTLSAGAWEIRAYHHEGRHMEPKVIEVPDSAESALATNIEISLVSFSKTLNQRLGLGFFAFLIVTLLCSLFWWADRWEDESRTIVSADLFISSAELHLSAENAESLAGHKEIAQMVDSMQSQIDKEELVSASPQLIQSMTLALAEAELITSTDETLIANTVSHLRQTGNLPDTALPAANALDTSKADTSTESHNDSLDTLIAALSANELDWYATLLDATRDSIDINARRATLYSLFEQRVESFRNTLARLAKAELSTGSGQWTKFRWIASENLSLNILFWAFIGTLIRLLMVIQRYLRFNRFYIQGMVQHAALLVCVPVITFVFVKVASFVRLSTSTESLSFDLSDPQVMSVAAFLIALSPWSIWDRVLGVSRGMASGGEQSGA